MGKREGGFCGIILGISEHAHKYNPPAAPVVWLLARSGVGGPTVGIHSTISKAVSQTEGSCLLP